MEYISEYITQQERKKGFAKNYKRGMFSNIFQELYSVSRMYH